MNKKILGMYEPLPVVAPTYASEMKRGSSRRNMVRARPVGCDKCGCTNVTLYKIAIRGRDVRRCGECIRKR